MKIGRSCDRLIFVIGSSRREKVIFMLKVGPDYQVKPNVIATSLFHQNILVMIKVLLYKVSTGLMSRLVS